MRVMNAQTAKQTQLEPRVYNSPLRDRQVEQTRRLILEALAEQLADAGLSDFSIPRLAQRAGVSLRTVYRYFPTRDALLDAFDEFIEQTVAVPPARTADEIAGRAEWLFPLFDEHELVMLAQHETPPGRAVRARGRRRRAQSYRSALKEVTSHLSPGESAAALAIVGRLLSSATWKEFRSEHGMDGAEAGRAVSWALRTLIADLRNRNATAAKQATTE
jgi:AcrR family transcriptional regulator